MLNIFYLNEYCNNQKTNKMSFRSFKKGKFGYLLFPSNRANFVNFLVQHEKRASNSWCFAQELAQNGGSWSRSHFGGKSHTICLQDKFSKLFLLSIVYFEVSAFSVFSFNAYV